MHIGDEMDISKEREAFEAEFSKIKSDIAFWLHTWDEEMQGYNHPVMCWFWYMWQAKKQATPEGFVLDAPARVGGGVFRKGVKWKTVIESAQRLYEHSKDEINPIVSPSDILKIATGELVLVPKDELTSTYYWEGAEHTVNCVSEYEMELEKGEIAELEKWEQTKSTKAFFANIYSDEDNFEIVEFDSIEAAELAIKENKAMVEAQEQSHE